MNRYVCIHAHCYQPPRENPWLESIELQDSAFPYHDWNSRICAESYAPNTASRILDSEHRIIDIVNNYSKISFNFGPTLLSWMQDREPEIYEAILEADKISRKNFGGHGSAIAQVYNHVIMPLASKRDKRTQIVWGIKDFVRRFKREPEGMWLAETAVDLETLDLLVECGIKFTILAPGQAQESRRLGDKEWQDVSGAKIDPRRPYLCGLPSGETITLFFYDGPLAHQISFGNLLDNGEEFAKKLLSGFSPENKNNELVHVATDGETYGHHHRFGDMALAYCLYYLQANNLAEKTIYGQYLEKDPPEYEARIYENSSWSCFHGVERWKNDCGCNSGTHQGWQQKWRGPLREAMDWLRDNLNQIYEQNIAAFIKEPWQARDEYIQVILDRSPETLENFLSRHANHQLSKKDKVKTLQLLEMQRHQLLMYTSCGWFFDEISGIETIQVMQYAARAIQLALICADKHLEKGYIGFLEKAQSNIKEYKTGAGVYERIIKTFIIDLLRAGVHYGVSSIFTNYPDNARLYTYSVQRESCSLWEVGKNRLAIGRILLRCDITLEEAQIIFAVLHLGDYNLLSGARYFKDGDAFSRMQDEFKENFLKNDIPETIKLIDERFSGHSYSIWHLFRDEQRKILNLILDSANKEIESAFRHIFEHNYAILNMAQSLDFRLPAHFISLAGLVLNIDIRKLIAEENINIERLKALVEESKRWEQGVDKPTLNLIVSAKIDSEMDKIKNDPENTKQIEQLTVFIETIEGLSLDLRIWKAQNTYFFLAAKFLSVMRQKASENRQEAKVWLEDFAALGDRLKIKCAV